MTHDPDDSSIREGKPTHSLPTFRDEARPIASQLRLWFLVGLLVLAVVGLFVVANYTSLLGWTPGNVERTVNRDLSTGSTREQIESFLDSKGWNHS